MPTTRRQLLQDTLAATTIAGIAFATSADAGTETPKMTRKENDAVRSFVHPGMLHSADDVHFMREKVAARAEPWQTAWEKMRTNKIASLEAMPGAVARVFRGPYNKPDIGSSALTRDSGAAYANALVGTVGGDVAHFRKAIEILDAWAKTLQAVEGHDQKLLLGLTAHRFCNAAELIRTYAPQLWPTDKIAAFQEMLRTVYYPPIRDFFPEANGNWDAAMACSLLCIGIFCDDHAIFDRAVDYLRSDGGNGSIPNYVYPSGQNTETTRDQGHAQLGMGMLAAACTVAQTQGVDLWGIAGNRLAVGFEHLAKYNLGEDVPCDGVPSAEGRGKLQPIYETVYRHYALEKGLPLPNVRRVLERIRPEGYDGSQPGWGTLTYYRGEAKQHAGDLLAKQPDGGLPQASSASEYEIKSPKGNLTAIVAVKNGTATYALRDRAGKTLLLPSPLGIEFDDGVPAMTGDFSVWEATTTRRTLTRPRPYGDGAEPVGEFQQIRLILRQNAAPHRVLRVEVRVYEMGLALRLTLPPNRDPGTRTKTARERVHFAFPEGATFYASYQSEDEFHPVSFSALKAGNWLPLTICTAQSGPYVSLLEVDDTTRAMPQTLMSPIPDLPGTLVTEARGPVTVGSEVSTAFPWHVVLVGQTPSALAQSHILARALWPQSLLPSESEKWIRPGKAIREVTLSTPGGIACIDFARANGLQYILYDAGWYGSEYDDASDARSVHLDPKRIGPGHPGLDLARVIAYGKEKGIGVFLYVNRRALEKQLPELAPLYESWGVAGIKFGFVNVGPEEWTRWIRDSVTLCAKHHLLVDIHDSYRPVGISGAYPNLLTQEGIRGNEHMPTPRHNCTLPYTRCLSGPADYTVCYRNNRLQTTDAHQMALAVLYYSPLTLLYWYNRPDDYVGLPELVFFNALPTIWEQTRFLSGEIGECAVVARQSGKDWFVGAITNESKRTIEIPMDFLDARTSYRLRIYADRVAPDGTANLPLVKGQSRIAIGEEIVKGKQKTRTFALPSAGGVALHFTAV